MKFKSGDRVIVTKGGHKDVKAIVIEDRTDNKPPFYHVRMTPSESKPLFFGWGSTCNIFIDYSDESIEIDIEEMRDEKLNTILE